MLLHSLMEKTKKYSKSYDVNAIFFRHNLYMKLIYLINKNNNRNDYDPVSTINLVKHVNWQYCVVIDEWKLLKNLEEKKKWEKEREMKRVLLFSYGTRFWWTMRISILYGHSNKYIEIIHKFRKLSKRLGDTMFTYSWIRVNEMAIWRMFGVVTNQIEIICLFFFFYLFS